MANKFGSDILIQSEHPEKAAAFYVTELGFEITGETTNMISLHGDHINLFIERGPTLGPVLEVTVCDVEEAKARLTKQGCEIVKDEPDFPRCYVRDPHGLIYNLIR
jgi:catechol 2,3-dioxygenase-like lactoylglutathione lyase family enzyme